MQRQTYNLGLRARCHGSQRDPQALHQEKGPLGRVSLTALWNRQKDSMQVPTIRLLSGSSPGKFGGKRTGTSKLEECWTSQSSGSWGQYPQNQFKRGRIGGAVFTQREANTAGGAGAKR